MFPQFQRFLAQYGLKTYYIGDWDNISNIAHIDYYPYREELKAKRNRPARRQIKYHYEELVTYIKTTYPDLYQTIISKIQSLSTYEIYILKQGSIESYVDTKKKGLDEMIAFCKYRYEQRKENPAFAQKRAELNEILEHIFFRK